MEFFKRQSALRITDLISLDEIWRFRDRVVGETDLNCRFPPNSHVQPRKFDPWLLFESRGLIWHPNVKSSLLVHLLPLPSRSFRLVFNPHGHTFSSRPPVVKRSLGTPLILYSQSIYFRGSPLEFLSFSALRSRYRLSLRSAGIHSSHAIPNETRQFSLFLSLFICLFFCIFYVYFFALLHPDSSPFDTLRNMRVARNVKFVQCTRTK